VVHWKDRGVAEAERHDLGAGLRARALLDQQEFAASEVSSRIAQQNDGL
jgi:hypothetical protein